MSSQLVRSTIQACILTVVSNLISQGIKSYQTDTPFSIRWLPIFQFVLFTALNTPPNFLWQSFLESAFPATHLVPSKSAIEAASSNNEKELDREESTNEILESKLSIRNTLTKFALDQTFGATFNTLIFSLAFAGFNGKGYADAMDAAKAEFWPLIRAGWKLWPAVSLLNYGFVKSVAGRTLVGNMAGMAWGVYVSLMRS